MAPAERLRSLEEGLGAHGEELDRVGAAVVPERAGLPTAEDAAQSDDSMLELRDVERANEPVPATQYSVAI